MKQIEFEGETHDFPDDFTDQDIASALSGGKKLSALESGLDLAGSLNQGFQESLGAAIGFPTDVYNLARQGTDWLAEKAAQLVTGTDITAPPPTKLPFGSEFVNEQINSVLGKHEPKTDIGKGLRTIGQFSVGPQSLARKVAMGTASELAGRASEGTPYEPYFRAAAPLVSEGIASLASRPDNAARFLSKRTGNVTPQEYNLAQKLQQKAAEIGTPLTASEALQQVTGDKTLLPETQRVLEQTTRGGPVLREFYRERPALNAIAAKNAFNKIAEESITPSQIPPAIQDAAQTRISNIEAAINEKSRPFYEASRTDVLPQSTFKELQKIPAYPYAANAVTKDPILGPTIQDLSGSQIGRVDAVKKYLSDMYESAVKNEQNFRAAEIERARSATAEAATKASPNYKTALEIQQEGRSRFLEPEQKGPIGQLAGTPTFQGQKSVLFSPNPMSGSEKELSKAISDISGLNEKAVSDFVRQYLSTSFNESTQALPSGLNQFGAAKYAAQVAGNKQQAKNLEAIVRALPDGENKWEQINNLLDVFKAQGKRMPVGSATDFNKMIREEMQGGTPAQEALETALSPKTWTNVKGRFDDWRYNKIAEDASRLLTSPEGLSLIEKMKKVTPVNPYVMYPYLYQVMGGGR